jgi:hypothetical protein
MADNTTLNTGSGGDVIGSDDISSVKFQRVKLIHGIDGVNDGDVSTINPYPVRILNKNPQYRFISGVGAAGASQVHFDLFNATSSGKTMKIISVKAIKDGSAAVTGVLGVKLYLTFTTAVGTGGTAHTENNTTITGTSISEMDAANAALPAQVTGRLRPTGGATGGAVIATRNVFTEETSAASYAAVEFLDILNVSAMQPLVCAPNTGIRVVQGSVASVGNLDFEVIFELE